jgi:hypothetical protein
MTRTLVCGWFSLAGGEATAGDLLSMEAVRGLAAVDGPVDVATNEGFAEGPRWERLDPADYDRLVFVCGPLHGDAVRRLVDRFADRWKVAVNVSVVDPELARRFDVVVARDDGDTVEPDLALRAHPSRLPLVGVVRAHPQPEYPAARHQQVHGMIRLALASRPCAVVDFDTRVHPSADPLSAHGRSSQEVSELAARMDAVVTTRLHGLVLSLARGIPAVAVDPVAGGAKVARQADAIGWPCVLRAEDGPEDVARALTWCLTEDGRDAARRCVAATQPRLEAVVTRVHAALSGGVATGHAGGGGG